MIFKPFFQRYFARERGKQGWSNRKKIFFACVFSSPVNEKEEAKHTRENRSRTVRRKSISWRYFVYLIFSATWIDLFRLFTFIDHIFLRKVTGHSSRCGREESYVLIWFLLDERQQIFFWWRFFHRRRRDKSSFEFCS